MDKFVKMVTCTVDCISDDQLRELAFTVYVKRAAFILTRTNIISDPVVEVKYVVQVLWTLLERSSHSMRQKFAQYISKETPLIISTLKTMCKCLVSKGENIGMILIYFFQYYSMVIIALFIDWVGTCMYALSPSQEVCNELSAEDNE